MLVVLFLLSTSFFVWFALSLPSVFSSEPVIPVWEATLFISIIGGGFFLGAANPLFYELAVELTYPISEGTSAGLLTLINNIGCLLFFGVTPVISAEWINILMVATVFLSAVIMIFIPIVYKRSERDVERSSLIPQDEFTEKKKNY